jgi:hypothetical protein
MLFDLQEYTNELSHRRHRIRLRLLSIFSLDGSRPPVKPVIHISERSHMGIHVYGSTPLML